jgi:transcriptional regulator with XRE-family HTH domain
MARLPEPHTLRRRRRILGLSLRQVAAALGVSYSELSYWERGYEPVRPSTQRKWKDVAVRYSRLLAEEEAKARGGIYASMEED